MTTNGGGIQPEAVICSYESATVARTSAALMVLRGAIGFIDQEIAKQQAAPRAADDGPNAELPELLRGAMHLRRAAEEIGTVMVRCFVSGAEGWITSIQRYREEGDALEARAIEAEIALDEHCRSCNPGGANV